MALDAIKPNSIENSVQDLWQCIIGLYFPYDQSYRHSYKASILANNNMPDVTVIQVLATHPNADFRVAADWAERHILMIECKRPSMDTPTQWDNTIEGQFLDDLLENLNASCKIFGAVAIGKKVKFFRFDGKKPTGHPNQLVPLHQDVIDLSDHYQFPHLAYWLDHIKGNGWQWASS
ncbi:uncharacterized protein DSM5745_09166 [Aspergillus mulundensis]|uniref:Uncharacterized protein n=1 Tax=Aspergillus mulundensis TaxID=1810919 RepID=A0A3D8R063_9EURO|nr:hypothetical protein DSM5745_09166 [Aspergillus mulundensis]RDW67300.1 hypothetical protein DSM5745_09166 [Aspergillus mulundensis]